MCSNTTVAEFLILLSSLPLQLDNPMQQVTPKGGGAVGKDGAVTPAPNLVHEPRASSVVVPAKSAVILLHHVNVAP